METNKKTTKKKRNLQDRLRLTKDTDFWFKDSFFDKIFSSAESAISSIEENLNSVKEYKGNRDNFRRRALL
jgi:hypothetical protein